MALRRRSLFLHVYFPEAELEQEIADVVSSWESSLPSAPARSILQTSPLLHVEDKRLFTARRDGRVQAVLACSPVPAADGWYLEDLVRVPGAAVGASELLVVSALERLRPLEDGVAGLQTLKDQGLRLVGLSNGDPDMLERGVAYSGTADLFDRVISVEAAGSFKPDEVTYRTATELLGIQPGEVCFVANHAFDCIRAKAAGMRTASVDRRGRPFGNE